MADELFSIEWQGLDELSDALSKMEKETDKIILEEYTKLGLLAEQGAKALVHHDEGTLEDSLNFDPAKREGSNIVVRGGTNVVYALRRHEEPGIGPGTQAKPNWRGYRPGSKYLENAIKAIERDYNDTNDRILQRILETK